LRLACCCCVRVRWSSRRSCCQKNAPTLRSLRLRHPTRCHHDPAPKPDRPIRPLRQLVNVPRPVFEPAEPTSRQRALSRVTIERGIASAPAPLPRSRGHLWRVGPSFKELLNATTQQTLCQVKSKKVGVTVALPRLHQFWRRTEDSITRVIAMSSRVSGPQTEPLRKFAHS
jgi:hypothetical protein